MTEIYVDTDQMRWQITLLRVFLDSVRGAQRDIFEATQIATGYEGQLQRQVIAIAGNDESLVSTLANELEEMIYRVTQITDAFEAADAIGASNPTLGADFTRLIDGGLLLSSLPSTYRYWDPLLELEERLWLTHDPDERALLPAGGINGHLRAFAQSSLFPGNGSEADYWRALQVFLYVSGAIDTQPPLDTWQAAAQASGVELDAYVSTATGVKEEHVDAWFRAAETHAVGLKTAIGEIVDMAQAGESIEQHFGFGMEGNWTESDKDAMAEGVLMVSYALAGATPERESAADLFKAVFGGDVQFLLKGSGETETWWCQRAGFGFQCEPLARGDMSPQLTAHELAHAFNATIVNNLNEGLSSVRPDLREHIENQIVEISPYGELADTRIVVEIDGGVVHVSGRPPGGGYERTDLGFASQGAPWQQHSIRRDGGNAAGEDFADMFLGWTFLGFSDDPAGQARYAWMEQHMPEWIPQAAGPLDLSWFEIPTP
ncbi:MAG TPA: hypothetical protein VI520_05285 [Anaerolineales bacterium]|nr:hypothetical protein [Anaerolineales bacterium]